MDGIVAAATVVCLRHRLPPVTRVIDLSPRPGLQLRPRHLAHLFSLTDPSSTTPGDGDAGRGGITVTSGWQVLLGQGEVVNWLRSSPGKTAVMRYPGELKFAGGTVDAGETVEQAARRELQEEFHLEDLPLTAEKGFVARPFNVKVTRPVQGRSYMMHNFVALEDENPWLERLDVDAINASLAERRRAFGVLLATNAFWTLPHEERSLVAPEVRQVMWLDLPTAIETTLASLVVGDGFVPVNDWQREEFARHGVARRDPMFQTLMTLVELNRLEDPPALRRHIEANRADKGEAAPTAVAEEVGAGDEEENGTPNRPAAATALSKL